MQKITVGRVRAARQGLRITAGSEWDEHTIRGRATRAYLPFHDGCHHLRVRSASPPPRWEGFLTKKGKFLSLFFFFASGESSRGNLLCPTKGHMKVMKKRAKKNQKSGDINLGERNGIKHTEGETWSRRASRPKIKNTWMCAGMALEHTVFEIKLVSNYKLLFSYSLIWITDILRCTFCANPLPVILMHIYSM